MTSSKRTHRYPMRRKAAPASATTASGFSSVASAGLDLKDYVFLNLIFDALIIVQALVVKAILPDMYGLVFFAGFLIVGFLLVSIIDYLVGRALPSQELSSEDSSP